MARRHRRDPAPARSQPDRVRRLVRDLARHPAQLGAGPARARGAGAGALPGDRARPGGGAAGDRVNGATAQMVDCVGCPRISADFRRRLNYSDIPNAFAIPLSANLTVAEILPTLSRI